MDFCHRIFCQKKEGLVHQGNNLAIQIRNDLFRKDFCSYTYIYIYVYHNIYNSQTKKNGWPPLQKRRISFFGAPFVFGEKI